MARKADGDRIGRWNCHTCKGSFNVLSGTIFQKTRIPLQKWFLGIGLMVNAKKSISSHQLARDLDVAQSTALHVQERIRASMVAEERGLLQGIIEADETYIGGKPRKRNKHAEQYADGETHTNTIEGFWSLVKRAWFGSHHHYSRKYLPLFMAESCWKYNNRNNDNAFRAFLQGAMA